MFRQVCQAGEIRITGVDVTPRGLRIVGTYVHRAGGQSIDYLVTLTSKGAINAVELFRVDGDIGEDVLAHPALAVTAGTTEYNENMPFTVEVEGQLDPKRTVRIFGQVAAEWSGTAD